MTDAGGADRPVVCCDLDGVVWRGEVPIEGAAAGIARLRDAGLRVVFLTNNSNGRVRDNVARLAASGVEADVDDVVSSAQAAAALLAHSTPPGSRVLACAGPGVVEALEACGFEVVAEVPADAVVVGWHRDFDFERLRRAADGVRSGARFVATNLDPTYPGSTGLLPGAGSLVAAVRTAGGRREEVAGKPEPAMAALVRARFRNPVVMIGDRPSTDGAFAAALGVPFALVLSGVVGMPGEEKIPDPPPEFVARDLGELAPMLVAAFAPAPR
ncbi:MAG TPA: HAD-IIA family hydrolase [Acidimicrobiia bacterium]|nr:HAD-IIA family hydrolase [Acidimicrobiia bacterium]